MRIAVLLEVQYKPFAGLTNSLPSINAPLSVEQMNPVAPGHMGTPYWHRHEITLPRTVASGASNPHDPKTPDLQVFVRNRDRARPSRPQKSPHPLI